MAKKKTKYVDEIKPKKSFLKTGDWGKVVWTTGTEYYIDIPWKFKEKHVMKLWCEQNCSYPVVYYTDVFSRTEIDSIKIGGRIFFFSEEDAAAFKLRWS